MTDVAHSKARRLKLKTTILTAWSGVLTEQAAKVTEDLATIRKAITTSRNQRRGCQ